MAWKSKKNIQSRDGKEVVILFVDPKGELHDMGMACGLSLLIEIILRIINGKRLNVNYTFCQVAVISIIDFTSSMMLIN